jgi:hypothetical protein
MEGLRHKGRRQVTIFHEPDLGVNEYLYEYWWKFVELILNKVCEDIDMMHDKLLVSSDMKWAFFVLRSCDRAS